ncbi:hypothetical protein XA68_13643 [Ophiocordyceps unilateralis]|uniref:Major facilitator superfamily (MFS) profile domain-containing protein n=1 Tax=Ophiocordyceps unilateralis TaxID=268505 RepID=A0A2A9PNF0_OPHUN|nr:hypothetical protein XA68_13643 [Ophiocordyceps unilateralis]
MCAACCIVAGAMPNWPSLGLFIALLGFGGGGNLILDSVVFLEYLPSSKQWLLTALACWWGLGQAVASSIGWIFMVPPQWNCTDSDGCTRDNNWGWRFTLFAGGGLVLTLSLLRITVIRLRETPKYQLSVGQEAELVETFHFLALKYDRSCSLTLEKLEACGTIRSVGRNGRFSFVSEALAHVGGLFSTRKLAMSTTMLWFSWSLIGLAYALFFVFLPTYLKNSGVTFERPEAERWRNLVITDLSGVPGPVIAGLLCNLRPLGRRYTMTIGALCTAAFFFAYPTVKTATQDLILACFIACFIHVYYGTLYAYTPEVLPSAHRATGNGIAVACNRVMGIVSAVVASGANTSTPVPLYICGGLLITAAVVATMFPLEPCSRRSS